MANSSKPPFSIVQKLLFGIALVLALFAIVQLLLIGKEYMDGRADYTEIKEQVIEEKVTYIGPTERVIDFESLKAINSEAVAWLYVPAVGIDYPVMYSGDNKKYLNMTSSGTENSAGAIFLDGRNHPDFSDLSSYIYGHHMRDQSMFSPLLDFQKKEVFESNPYFYIYRPGMVYQYKIFSVHDADASSDDYSIGFDTKEAYAAYLNMTATKTMYATNETVAASERIVTLSTCKTYNLTNVERFVVQGKLVKIFNVEEDGNAEASEN